MYAFEAFRLLPGMDLYESIVQEATKNGPASHSIVTCVGSLKQCKVRLAGATADSQSTRIFPGPLEIVSLVGTIAQDRAHIHISVSDKEGNVFGGHLMPGSTIETTAEVVLANLRKAGITLTREMDPSTGFRELCVTKTV
ncbi:DNA-binding protein [Tritrichomonas foetus]|uniref:DNA-binding protein n=1 Tax=Tritrichomonas foetus TaxID=1144522 RepID=A0A1J4JUW8_9EUKA|nr:DNA-binding protein [Tritrichomonas foetus]|eukprot:OHT01053.1 DNA-binding protein [Tritrichomonas foetus]